VSKCIVYFHGFNGSPEADSKIAIQQAFPEHLVLSYPIVHQEGPTKIAAKLEKAINSIFDTYHPEDVILVGNSAGGLWAYHFAKQQGSRMVLLNPSLEPVKNLTKFGLEAKVLQDYAEFNLAKGEPSKNHHVFLSDQDDVVKPDYAAKKFKNVTWLKGEGHRIVNMGPVINIMKKHLMH